MRVFLGPRACLKIADAVAELGNFHELDWSAPFDFDAIRKALPPDATCSGMYLERSLAAMEEFGARAKVVAGAPEIRASYSMFRKYPYLEYVAVMEVSSRFVAEREGISIRESLRRLGQSYYPMLANTLAGKVVFGVLGRDPERVFAIGNKGWEMALNFGNVRVQRLEDRHYLYQFVDTPTFVDTTSVGILEGAAQFLGVDARVRIDFVDAGNAVLELRW